MRLINLNFFIAGVAAALLLCSCSGESPPRTPGSVREDGYFRVAALNENNYPYLYWDENGQARGIEPDIARRLAASMQAEALFSPYSREDVVAAVSGGTADFGIACFIEDSSRGGLTDTSGYYARRRFVLTRRGESYPYESVMSGHTVLSDNTCDFTYAQQTSIRNAVSRLLDGSADAVICDEFAACAAVEENDEKLQAELFQNSHETVYVAVVASRQEKLYAFIDGEIAKLVADGAVREIASAY